MVRSVEQIAQELAALDQTVASLGEAFYAAYQAYLTALGSAMRQQLVIAGYHICTRGYPEQFLQLSLDQRQALQQSLQRLGKEAEADLISCLKPVTPDLSSHSESQSASGSAARKIRLASSEEAMELSESAFLELSSALDAGAEALLIPSEMVLELHLSDNADESDGSESDPSDSDDSEFDDSEFDSSEFDKPQLTEAGIEPTETDRPAEDPSAQSTEETTEETTVDDEVPNAAPVPTNSESADEQETDRASEAANRPLRPKDIARWQSRLEAKITEALQDLSHTTNRVLQKAKILPQRLPEPVLEVATKADLSSETTASPPNLLNLLIEADSDQDKPTMTQILAVRLRLSELEFGDAATAAHRSQLRQLMAQLSKCGREYQQKQKEYAIAQAEAAWRSSWFEGE